MEIKTEHIPEVGDTDIAFPTVKADPTLLSEAKERGFYNGNTEWNKLFSDLFFNGKSEKQYRYARSEEFNDRAERYLRALMGSFGPKHEEKEAVCALLLSEFLEP